MKSKLRCIGLLAIAGLMSTGACDSDDSVTPDPVVDPAPDTGAMPDTTDMPGNPSEQPSQTLLRGTITRDASPVGNGDAVGNLYVLVFDNDPLGNNSPITLVDMLVIEEIDMTGNDNAFPYEIKDIDPSAAVYHVVALLDDNLSIDSTVPQSIRPDSGDLISVVQQNTTPAIKIEAVGTYELDLVLNTVWPG